MNLKMIGLLGLLAVPAFAQSTAVAAPTHAAAPVAVATPAPATVATPVVTAKGKETKKVVKVKAAPVKGRHAVKK